MIQRIFSIIAPVEHVPTVQDALKSLIGCSPGTHPDLPLCRLPTLHFASLLLSADSGYRVLVFENNIDGTVTDYLRALLRIAPNGIDRLYRGCRGYPREGVRSDERAVLRYLRSHVVQPHLYHVGSPGKSVAAIRIEASLRQRIGTYLDLHHAELASSGSSGRILTSTREALGPASCPDHERRRTDVRARAERLYHWSRLVAAVMLVFGVTAATLGAGIWLLGFWQSALVVLACGAAVRLRAGRTASRSKDRAIQSAIPPMPEAEDLGVQNHLSSIVVLQSRGFSRIRTWLLLRTFSLWYRTWYASVTPGRIEEVRSIHFCQWTLLDRGRRLLFVTNYDGDWTAYMDDFIEHVGRGVAMLWGATAGFPGAADPELFKRWCRTQQQEHALWYSAYPDLTVQEIANNDAVCRGFHAANPEAVAREWCIRLTAIPQAAGTGRS